MAGLHSLYAARVRKAWAEGAGGDMDGRNALDGEVTYLMAAHNQTPWEVAGLRGASDVDPPESSADYGDQLGVWVDFDVTQMVSSWVASRSSNMGVKISQDATVAGNPYTAQIIAQFHSAQSDEADLRPMLVVAYTEEVSLDAGNWHLYR